MGIKSLAFTNNAEHKNKEREKKESERMHAEGEKAEKVICEGENGVNKTEHREMECEQMRALHTVFEHETLAK